jgi:hypothetical protein
MKSVYDPMKTTLDNITQQIDKIDDRTKNLHLSEATLINSVGNIFKEAIKKVELEAQVQL